MSGTKFTLVFYFLFILLIQVNGQNLRLSSPSGNITLSISNSDQIFYTLAYKGKNVIATSRLGFTLSKPVVSLTKFSILRVDSSTYDETWTPVWN